MAASPPVHEIEPVEPAGEPTLDVQGDGFEGPLDRLLELARRQTLDLDRASILGLAEQYLGVLEETRLFRLELAADSLVMTASLAYIRTCLLMPQPSDGDEPCAADLANALALRLRRLETVRGAARRCTLG